MTPSSAPSASTIVKTAALLMAVPALLAPIKAAAQQMAAANTSAQFAACDQIKDPAKSAQCAADVSMRDAKASLTEAKDKLAASQARLTKVEARMGAADDNIACAKYLMSKKAEGIALDATRLNREKGCIYARELGM